MKKLIKVLAVIMLLAMVFTAAGCKKAEKLTVATNAEFPPFEFKDGEEFVGIDMELAYALGEKLGMEVEIVDMEFDSVVAAVQSGQCKIGMSGLTINPDREKKVDFTISYYDAEQAIIVKEDGAIATKADLEGKKIGVQTGTTGETAANDIKDAQVSSYSNGAEAVVLLLNGTLDAVVIDNQPAKTYVEKNDGIKAITGQFEAEKYGFAVKKGDAAFLKKVNDALEELIDSGEYQSILDKYID